MIKAKHQYIIAIGASAGSLEEINSFFDYTPLDGVSYVIVQHLSPELKSRMIELLSRHSKLVIREAKEGMPVKSNQIYLIPDSRYLTMSDYRFHLTAQDSASGAPLTIDRFFTSLATDGGSKAIAIVLSGLGCDGTEGIRAIRQTGAWSWPGIRKRLPLEVCRPAPLRLAW